MTKTMTISPVRKAAHPVRDTRRDQEWINEHIEEYRGQWVMVYECQLIAADPNIRQLLNKVPRGAYPEAVVTYIPMPVTMPSPPAIDERSAAVPADFIWRLNVDQYHAMIDAGILTGDDPVELLDGWLVLKMPKNPPHILVTELIQEALQPLIPAGWFINTQGSVTLAESEPEPDVMVVRGERRQYLDHHPGPDDIALVVEVAESSLQRDRKWKRQIYALAGIPIYWIANLPENRFEVYTDPTGPSEAPDYRHHQDYGPSDELPVVIGGGEIGRLAVRELLP